MTARHAFLQPDAQILDQGVWIATVECDDAPRRSCVDVAFDREERIDTVYGLERNRRDGSLA